MCSTREEADPEYSSQLTSLSYQFSSHIFSNVGASQGQWELISCLLFQRVLWFIVHSLSPRGAGNNHEFSSPLIRAGCNQVIISHIDVWSQVMWISHIYLNDSKPLQHNSLWRIPKEDCSYNQQISNPSQRWTLKKPVAYKFFSEGRKSLPGED